MIVGPHKGLFFVATALMCSASLYAEELTGPSGNPLARIFTGEPNRLTLPPDFPDAPLASIDEDDSCAPRLADGVGAAAAVHNASTSLERGCPGGAQPEPGARVLPGAVSASSTDAQAKVEPIDVGGTVQSH